MDDLQIAWRPLGELIPYARNARTHSDAQVAQIAASIARVRLDQPGAGGRRRHHHRRPRPHAGGAQARAGERAGDDLAHLSEAQKRAYVLADNQLALNAGWDEEFLAAELTELRAAASTSG